MIEIPEPAQGRAVTQRARVTSLGALVGVVHVSFAGYRCVMTSGVVGTSVCCGRVQGKVKVVAENRTVVHLDPTPNYDSHMAKSSLDVTPASQQQLYELYQVRLID